MIKRIENNKMGKSNLGWLQSSFHFSFAEYYNPTNMNFGNLRVINDDYIAPGTGFGMHPHKNMEIVTYVIEGELTHQDSMGNKSTIYPGDIQYMSAGSGIFHSETNDGSKELRLLQIWIIPNELEVEPNYGDYRFERSEQTNKWLHLVSNNGGSGVCHIHQDMNIYATTTDEETTFEVNTNRQGYLVLVKGQATINGIELNKGDAMEIIEEDITLLPSGSCEFVMFEMEKK